MWLAGITELRHRGQRDGYRERPRFDPIELWDVLEREEAEPWKRAAACIALGPSLDPSAVERIRTMAVLTTIPALHDVFEAVAAVDDDLLSKGVRALLPPQG